MPSYEIPAAASLFTRVVLELQYQAVANRLFSDGQTPVLTPVSVKYLPYSYFTVDVCTEYSYSGAVRYVASVRRTTTTPSSNTTTSPRFFEKPISPTTSSSTSFSFTQSQEEENS